jgi:hypothetical protein
MWSFGAKQSASGEIFATSKSWQAGCALWLESDKDIKADPQAGQPGAAKQIIECARKE